MGITGLVQAMKKHMREVTLDSLGGETAAIDVSAWICKAISVNIDAVGFVMKQVRRLMQSRIRCILVFDGAGVEAKREEKEKRERTRLKRASSPSKTATIFEPMIDVLQTSEKMEQVKTQIKKWCKLIRVRYVQAPNEADPQLAFLVGQGTADFVITEDGDLMVYGCRKILYKLSCGKGLLFEMDNFDKIWDAAYHMKNFVALNVAVGCDYFRTGVINFGTASALLLYKEMKPKFNFSEFIKVLESNITHRKVSFPEDFKNKFIRAVNTFHYQLVLDTNSETVVPYTTYPRGTTSANYSYAGDMRLAQSEYSFHPKEDADEHLQFVLSTLEAEKLFFCSNCLDVDISLTEYTKRSRTTNEVTCTKCGTEFEAKSYYKKNMTILLHEEFYPCENCDKIYLDKKGLAQHMRNSHHGKTFTCVDCGDEKTYKNLQTLKEHIQRKHLPTQSVQCEQCSLWFRNKGDLCTHAARTHRTELVLCDICGRGCSTNHNLAIHQTSHTDEHPYECTNCPKKFKDPNTLKQHTLLHHNADAYVECNDCGERFASQTILREHRYEVHAQVKWFCTKCNEGFKLKSQLTSHDKTHNENKPFQCKHCSKGYSCRGNLVRHIKVFHKLSAEVECEICGEGLSGKRSLLQHVRAVHKGSNDFECEICGKRYPHRVNLRQHVRAVHKGSNDFECEICGKRYPHRVNLRQHIRRAHEPSNDLECEICGKRYRHRVNLTQHIKQVHDRSSDVECDICGKKSHTKGDLRQHIRKVHERSTQVKCEICGKSFSCKSALTTHVKGIHEEDVECQICRKSYSCQKGLLRHMRTLHAGFKESQDKE